MAQYDKSHFYVDFSNHSNLTDEEKADLENIQNMYRPMERIDSLTPYLYNLKITSDEYETMTGVPYEY